MLNCGDSFGLFVKWVIVMSAIALCMLPAIIHILNQAG